jgi:hypothetical protein
MMEGSTSTATLLAINQSFVVAQVPSLIIMNGTTQQQYHTATQISIS